MKTSKRNFNHLNVSFSGYGHYRVSMLHYGKEISCITNNMPAIDDYKSDEFEKDGRALRKKRGYMALREECIRVNKNN